MTIHQYVEKGDLEGVRREVRRGASLEDYDDKGRTPLLVALGQETVRLEMIQNLISLGADVNSLSKKKKQSSGYSQYSPLGLAVERCSRKVIDLLLSAGADVRNVDPNGYGILLDSMHRDFVESHAEHFQLIADLIEAGAPLDCESNFGESVVSVASHRGNFDIIKLMLQRGANPSPLMWNDLFYAVADGNVSSVKALASRKELLDSRDRWERTPFLLAVQASFQEIASYLLEQGSDLHAKGRCGKTAIMFAVESHHPEILKWLIELGCAIEEVDEFGHTALKNSIADEEAVECVRILLKSGAKIEQEGSYGFSTIAETSEPEMIELLLAAGANLSDVGSSDRQKLLGYSTSIEPDFTDPEFRYFQHRSFGRRNPERMNNPFWEEMVRSRSGAYQACVAFGFSTTDRGAIWCYSRFGQSLTRLSDGRSVEIGGEHEDWYDPDFCIYNDVVVHHGDGNFDLYGYPEDIFPPTDFHSATLIGSDIYIIGGLRYKHQRVDGQTYVYKLNTDTFVIERVECDGEMPGWIYKHLAKQVDDKVVEIFQGQVLCGQEGSQNDQIYRLDLTSRRWSRH